MNIPLTVDTIIKKHKTRDPFKLANLIGITVLYEHLGEYKGYYSNFYRHKIIHINKHLTKLEQKITCAHELGHAFLHTKSSTPFMRKNTLFSIDKLELEANKFSAYLLIDDTLIQSNHLETIDHISSFFEVPKELVCLKFKL